MSGDAIALHRCQKCNSAAMPVDIVNDGEVKATLARLCEVHLAEAMEGADENRAIFEGILALGVSRDTANVMMIAKFDHERSGGL